MREREGGREGVDGERKARGAAEWERKQRKLERGERQRQTEKERERE